MRSSIALVLLIHVVSSSSGANHIASSHKFGTKFRSLAVACALAVIPAEMANICPVFAADATVVPTSVSIEKPKVVLNEYVKSTSTGIEYYDYKIGEGPAAKFGDKVAYNYKGRLAGTTITISRKDPSHHRSYALELNISQRSTGLDI